MRILLTRVDAQLKGINVAEFLEAFPQAKGMMTGTLDGSAKMKGTVTNSSDPLAGITGSGQASIRNGQMPSLQLGSNLRTLAKMASVGPANGDPSSFSSLSTDFRIADARLTNNKITLVGNGVDVDGSGSMTMAGEGSLDYQGDASLAASGNNPLATVLGGSGRRQICQWQDDISFHRGWNFRQAQVFLERRRGGTRRSLPSCRTGTDQRRARPLRVVEKEETTVRIPACDELS